MRRASWSKQFVYGALTLILVGSFCTYLYKTSQKSFESGENLSVPASVEATSTGSVVPKSRVAPKYGIVKPIDLQSSGGFKKESVYVNPVTHDVVTYEQSPIQSRNPVEFVLLNGKKIGEYTGYRLTDFRVSPTGQYVSFESLWVCGAECSEFYVYLIDFKEGKYWSVRPPISRIGYDTNLFIESSSWIGNGDVLEITAYMTDRVDSSEGPVRMRVTHKQVWNYDLTTREFTLIRELPE